jgi:hypothetical protein
LNAAAAAFMISTRVGDAAVRRRAAVFARRGAGLADVRAGRARVESVLTVFQT